MKKHMFLLLLFFNHAYGQITASEQRAFAQNLNVSRRVDDFTKAGSYKLMTMAYPKHSYTDIMADFERLETNAATFDEFIYQIVKSQSGNRESSLRILYKFCGKMTLSQKIYDYISSKYSSRLKKDITRISEERRKAVAKLKADEEKRVREEQKMQEIEEEKRIEVNQESEFPGGAAAWQRYLKRNLRYPQAAIDKEIQGEVVVSFTVKMDSTVDNLEIVSPIKGYIEEEAIRVIKDTKWSPALKNGVPIESKKKQSIIFGFGPGE